MSAAQPARSAIDHDAHCHVADFRDTAGLLESVRACGQAVVAVTVSPEQYHALRARLRDEPNIIVAPGLHPQALPGALDALPALLEAMADAAWIGEIGLDGVDESPAAQAAQSRVLEAVLDRCVQRGREDARLSLHGRRRAGALLEVLDGGFPRAVLHWFSGDAASLGRAVAERRWFSVNPSMSGSRSGRTLLRLLPVDRVVYESDGPYAMCGANPATPGDGGVVVRTLASLWSRPEAWVVRQLNANWSALMG